MIEALTGKSNWQANYFSLRIYFNKVKMLALFWVKL